MKRLLVSISINCATAHRGAGGGNIGHLVGIVDITGLRAEHSWVEVGVEVPLKQASCGLYWQKANE